MKPFKIQLLLLAVIFAFTPSRLAAELSEQAAQEYLKKGAKVVDVRTTAEFEARHLANVVNIPLDDVKTRFPVLFTNKTDVVLLHCRSGRRSGVAVNQLKALGYTNVFNLGSFAQAEKVLGRGVK